MNAKTSPVTVFILDDDKAVCTAIGRLVRSAGMVPVSVSGPGEIVAAAGWKSRSCVITDIRMPSLDGLLVPDILRSHGCDLPVIFVTAQDNHDTRAAAKRAGAAAFFRKPVDDNALLDAIEWALRDDNSHVPA